MITKERLKELIKQKATIYTWSDMAAYEQFGTEMTFDEKVYEIKLRKSDKIHEGFLGGAVLESADHPIMALYTGIPLGSLYETKWEMEFSNITRTDTLSLPTFEDFMLEFKGYFKFIEKYGHNCVMNGYYDERLGSGFIDICVDGTQINDFEFSKENYTEVCRLAKKLFLGEKE